MRVFFADMKESNVEKAKLVGSGENCGSIFGKKWSGN